PKRAVKPIHSLSIDSRATARSALFSTTFPSCTACGRTCTPAMVASPSRCGVMPLSAIHWFNARNRYGRWLVMRGGGASVIGRSRGDIAQLLLGVGQAADEARVAEDAVAVILDRLAAILGHRDLECIQAPDDRGH